MKKFDIERKYKMKFLNGILGYIEDIEDLTRNLEVRELYSNKKGITNKLVKRLGSIYRAIKCVQIFYPNFSEKCKIETNIDFLKLGREIEEGVWHYTVKNVWNAIVGINKLKEEIFELEI